ncbi:FUSC family protein [Microbacterium sp. 2FI]|uniref:FUSC family protein n=1 Tax=Microbacterium sp. 2FI TaxID=2502193 RepID=UPI0010F450B4|nr:FUSC family protein [Microbacterium sp. 2FI]
MTSSPPLAWSWRNVAHGAVLALPAAVVSTLDPALGVPLAVGVLPAAALGLGSTRRQRAMVMVVGAVAAVSILLGSLVASLPVLAVVLVFVLCVAVALFAANPAHRLAPLALMLGLPLYGAGLSESPWTAGAAAALLITAGSVYGWLVSLAWPAADTAARPPRPAAPRSVMLQYGIQIGLAGATAAAIGFALGVDHPGWACMAALLVSRPDRGQLDARAWGRSASVVAGALVACAIALAPLGDIAIALIILATLAAATGTAGSRWYVFPFFSTVIVLSMLLLGETETPAHWFLERVAMTLLGVALALAAAWIVSLARGRGTRAPPPTRRAGGTG